MTFDNFWKIIASARVGAADSGDVSARLEDTLCALEAEEIRGFAEHAAGYARLAARDELRAAAGMIIAGLASVIGALADVADDVAAESNDDAFDGFIWWLMAQGRATFVGALQDADSLADLEIDEQPAVASLLLAAERAFLEVVGAPLGETRATTPPEAADLSPERQDTPEKLLPRTHAKYVRPSRG